MYNKLLILHVLTKKTFHKLSQPVIVSQKILGCLLSNKKKHDFLTSLHLKCFYSSYVSKSSWILQTSDIKNRKISRVLV